MSQTTPIEPERRATTGVPRWVKVFGIVLVVLVLAFAILHLTGNSLGGAMDHMQHTGQGVQHP